MTVSSLTDLQTALANSSVKTVVLSQAIAITENVTLDGQGKTVQVVTPYCNADGTSPATSYSSYNLFTISGGYTLTLKNMTCYGGYNSNNAGGIYVYSNAELIAENCTFARSYRAIYNAGKVLLKNSNVVRNVCQYGGGLLGTGSSTTVFDGCSLSENRSLSNTGGGGAMEIQRGAVAIFNNSTIANNSSTEIGGALNIYQGTVYLLNCTVSGNSDVTNYSPSGGALGNNSGTLYAVNTVLANNYHFTSSGTKVLSDIGTYGGSRNYLYNCLYTGIEGTGYTAANCKVGSETTDMAGYRTDGVLYASSSETDGYNHGVLLKKSGETFALYAPTSASGNATTGGTNTYFSYSDDLSSIKIGYGTDDAITALGSYSAATASDKVTTYYESGTRTEGVIGASAPINGEFYTVKMVNTTLTGGSVEGISILGDSYLKGTEITITATPADDYVFNQWTSQDGVKLSTDNPWNMTVNSDVTLVPWFKTASAPYNVIVPISDDYSITGVNSYAEGSSVTVKLTCSNSHMTFKQWNDGDGNVVSTDNPYTFTMPAADVYLYPEIQEAPKYTVTINSVEHCTTSGAKTDYQGTSVTVTATPETGYKFIGWKNGETTVSTSKSYTFTLTADITLTPVVEEIKPIEFNLGDGITGVADAYNSSQYPWEESTKGGVAFKSTNVGVNSSTSASTITLSGLDATKSYTLSFNYRVSSESGYDYMTIKVGNTTVANNISGTSTASNYYSQKVTGATSVVLTVSYFKDGSYASGDDLGEIWNLSCMPSVDLADGTSYEGTEQTGVNATYSRTVSNTYGTIVLPFKPTSADGITFYTIGNLTSDNIVLQEVSLANVEANKPYIFKANAAGTLTFSAENTTVYAASSLTDNETPSGVTILGSYDQMGSTGDVATDKSSYDYYYISNNQFWHATGTLEVNAYRAYLRMPKSSNAKSKLNIILDDFSTGINSVDADADDNAPAYNIAGQRVNKSHKGIIIKNGHKYLNK